MALLSLFTPSVDIHRVLRMLLPMHIAPNPTAARPIRTIQTMSGRNGCEWLPPLKDEPPGPLARTMLLITLPRLSNLGSARFIVYATAKSLSAFIVSFLG